MPSINTKIQKKLESLAVLIESTEDVQEILDCIASASAVLTWKLVKPIHKDVVKIIEDGGKDRIHYLRVADSLINATTMMLSSVSSAEVLELRTKIEGHLAKNVRVDQLRTCSRQLTERLDALIIADARKAAVKRTA
jgi:hypothetical protein